MTRGVYTIPTTVEPCFDTDFLAAGASELETGGVLVAAGMLVTVGVLVAGKSFANRRNHIALR